MSKQNRNELVNIENNPMVARHEAYWGMGEKREEIKMTNCQI